MHHVKSGQDLDVGYIGYSNSKHAILDDGMLKKGYESGKDHKDGLPVFCMSKPEKKTVE